MYNLRFQADRVESLSSDSKIKTLGKEIGILRVLLETMYNQCNEPRDLMVRAGPIGTLVGQIEKLVTSTHKLDKDLGVMMSEEQVAQLGQEFIEIVSRHVPDIAILEAIANDLTSAIENRGHNRVQ